MGSQAQIVAEIAEAVDKTVKLVPGILQGIADISKGTQGWGNYLLGKENIVIINNTGSKITVIIDKDILTDGGGGDLEAGEMDMFGRSGPTRVALQGKTAGELEPGKQYSLESDGKNIFVVHYVSKIL
jgi:hypothetical protein